MPNNYNPSHKALFNCNFTPRQLAALRCLAHSKDTPISAVIRFAVDQVLEANGYGPSWQPPAELMPVINASTPQGLAASSTPPALQPTEPAGPTAVSAAPALAPTPLTPPAAPAAPPSPSLGHAIAQPPSGGFVATNASQPPERVVSLGMKVDPLDSTQPKIHSFNSPLTA